MLVGAGVDTIVQKAATGKVDWGQFAMSGALGGFGGASVAAKAGLTGLKGTMVAGAASGGVSGAASGAFGFMRGPGPHTVMGAVGATAAGAGTGALLGAGGSAVGHGIASKAGWLNNGELPGGPATKLTDEPPRPNYVNLASPERTRRILYGDNPEKGGHRWPGAPGSDKTLFPKDWSDDRIMHEVSDIATNPRWNGSSKLGHEERV